MRHLTTPNHTTWHDDGSSYAPGRLDFFLYTDSVIEVAKSGTIWTPDLPAWYLSQWGLQTNDTPSAADHAPFFIDLRQPTPQAQPAVSIQGHIGWVELVWDPLPGASMYRVEASNSPLGPFETYSLLTETTLTISTQLNPHGFYRVRAVY